MTGIGGLLFHDIPHGLSRWRRAMNAMRFRLRHWRRRGPRRFILLCYRRTGSNLISGMLFNHPEILMHNEIFNENAVHSYYKKQVLDANWDYEGRDVNPAGFAGFMLDKFHERVPKFKENGAKPADCKAVGFKWFPNHAMQHGVLIARVQAVFEQLMADSTVHKIILTRENVAATYVSSRRSEETGRFLAEKYDDHRITVDVAHISRHGDDGARLDGACKGRGGVGARTGVRTEM